MRKDARLLLPLASLMLLTITTVRPESVAGTQLHDYVANGSFEAGIAGWSTRSATLDSVDATIVGPVHGASAARLTLHGDVFELTQSNWSGTPPGEYTLRVHVRTDSQLDLLKLQVSADPAENVVDREVSPQPGSWVAYQIPFSLPGNHSVTVKIAGSGVAEQTVFIDNVQLLGPEPATPTPTNTPTPLPTLTPSRTPTATKTHTPTKTATPAPAAQHRPAGFINGGFEESIDGKPYAWEKYGGELRSTTHPVRSGAAAAELISATGSTKWMFQTVQIEPAAGYEFSAWLSQADPGIASAFLRISWYESADGSGRAISTDDSTARLDTPAPEWRWLTTGPVAAPANAHSARLRIVMSPMSSSTVSLFIDDASFGPAEAQPRPSAVSDDSSETAASTSPQRPNERRIVHGTGSAPSNTAPAPAGSRIVINEILYDPAFEGRDAAGEWIEIYNAGTTAADIGGWTIADNRSADVLPGFLLEPGAFVVVAANHVFLQNYPDFDGDVIILAGNIGNQLGNDGDLVALIDPSGVFIDVVSWGTDHAAFSPPVPDVPEGHSIERAPPGRDTNTSGDFVDNESPSPGLPFAESSFGAKPNPQGADGARVQVVSAPGRSFAWILPLLVGASGTAVFASIAWRWGPVIADRLRREPW